MGYWLWRYLYWCLALWRIVRMFIRLRDVWVFFWFISIFSRGFRIFGFFRDFDLFSFCTMIGMILFAICSVLLRRVRSRRGLLTFLCFLGLGSLILLSIGFLRGLLFSCRRGWRSERRGVVRIISSRWREGNRWGWTRGRWGEDDFIVLAWRSLPYFF